MEVVLPNLQESLGDTSVWVLRVLRRGSQVLSRPSEVHWAGGRRWEGLGQHWACCWGELLDNSRALLHCWGEAWARCLGAWLRVLRPGSHVDWVFAALAALAAACPGWCRAWPGSWP